MKKFEEENHGILKGIEGSLIRWMGTVMHYDGPVEEKLELWRNCVKHYIGPHIVYTAMYLFIIGTKLPKSCGGCSQKIRY